MMDSFDLYEQIADLEADHEYLSYVHIVQRTKETLICDIHVFDLDSLIIQCTGLRFHEVGHDILDRILGKPINAPMARLSQHQQIEQTQQQELFAPQRVVNNTDIQRIGAKDPPPSESQKAAKSGLTNATVEAGDTAKFDDDTLKIILECIAKGTGTEIVDLTDDLALADIGKS